MPREVLLHSDSLFRAYIIAETAALAGDRVNLEILNCLKTAHFLTKPAPGALIPVYNCLLPTPELPFFPSNRLEKQVKVSSINIADDHDLAFGQGSQGSYYAGLSSASLATNDYNLFHLFPDFWVMWILSVQYHYKA